MRYVYLYAPRSCVVDLNFHQRRVGIVMWHPSAQVCFRINKNQIKSNPSAQNILLSCGSDNNVCVWNVGTGECLVNFALPELVLSASFNWDGSEVIFTCKDKKIRRVRLLKEKLEQVGLTVNIQVDPRTGNVEEEALAHEGSKGARAIYLKNGLVMIIPCVLLDKSINCSIYLYTLHYRLSNEN